MCNIWSCTNRENRSRGYSILFPFYWLWTPRTASVFIQPNMRHIYFSSIFFFRLQFIGIHWPRKDARPCYKRIMYFCLGVRIIFTGLSGDCTIFYKHTVYFFLLFIQSCKYTHTVYDKQMSIVMLDYVIGSGLYLSCAFNRKPYEYLQAIQTLDVETFWFTFWR